MRVFSIVSLLQLDLDEPVTLQCPFCFLFAFCFVLYFTVLLVSVTLFATRKIPYLLSYELFSYILWIKFLVILMKNISTF